MVARFLFAVLIIASGSVPAGIIHVQSRPIYGYSSDSVCLVSFPFAVNRDDFLFLADSGTQSLSAGMFAELIITDTVGHRVASQSTTRAFRAKDSADAKAPGYKIFDRFLKSLDPGVYGARLTVIDIVSKGEAVLDYGTIIVSPLYKQPAIGAMTAAYQIRFVGDSVDDQTARLVDNGYLVLPNPLGLYSLSDSNLWVYAEIYGLSYQPTSAEKYRLAFTILDRNDNIIRNFGFSERSMPGASVVVNEKFPLYDLPTGGFRLRMIVDDKLANATDTGYLTFWHIGSEEDIQGPQTAFDSLTLKEQISAMKYMMTSTEVTLLESLTSEGQRNFIRQYWQEHDAQRSVADFVSQDEIVRRFRFVNATFSTNDAHSNGWLTDRGRIYLKYGQWEERTDQSLPSEATAYDIWHYRSVKGGYYFVFVDVRGIADFRMVHSNAPGERYDPAWEEYFRSQLFMYR